LKGGIRRGVILAGEESFGEEQVTALDQVVGRVGAGGALKDAAGFLEQLDDAGPLLAFGPGAGLADGGIDPEGGVAELADEVGEGAAGSRVISLPEAGLADPQQVLIGPSAGLAAVGLEPLDGSVVVGHLVSGLGLVEDGLGQASGVGEFPREFGECGLRLLPEGVAKLVVGGIERAGLLRDLPCQERSGGQQQAHGYSPSAQNSHQAVNLNRWAPQRKMEVQNAVASVRLSS